jgi:hypothetical protein
VACDAAIVAADYVALQRLVDARDVDGVLAIVNTDDIAEAWCEGSARQWSERYSWAVDLLQLRAVATREDLVRESLLKLVEHAPNDDVLKHIGAGPLQEFVVADEARVNWIEQQAEGSERFRVALANVRIWGREPQWVCERVERAVGLPAVQPSHGWLGRARTALKRFGE